MYTAVPCTSRSAEYRIQPPGEEELAVEGERSAKPTLRLDVEVLLTESDVRNISVPEYTLNFYFLVRNCLHDIVLSL
jgi:hypothetical protein